ncbi:hypothetical protein C8R43DRAFT_1037912, partial [Mycena crocata]
MYRLPASGVKWRHDLGFGVHFDSILTLFFQKESRRRPQQLHMCMSLFAIFFSHHASCRAAASSGMPIIACIVFPDTAKVQVCLLFECTFGSILITPLMPFPPEKPAGGQRTASTAMQCYLNPVSGVKNPVSRRVLFAPSRYTATPTAPRRRIEIPRAASK